jgi:copper transport protein
MLCTVTRLCVLVLVVLIGAAGSAFAHATLIATVPADGAVLDASPRIVQLRFNEPVSPLVVHVIDAHGQPRQGVSVTARNETVEVTLPPDLPQGTQIVTYRIVSADGHPIAGSIVFSIGQPGRAPTAAQEPADALVPPLTWLVRIVLYLGLFVGVGGAFYSAWIAPQQSAAPGFARPALGLGLFAAVASLGLQGLDALGLDLSAVASPEVWMAGFGTSLGPAMIVAVGASVVGYLSLTHARRWGRTLSGAGLLAVGVAFALTGHASAASPQWLTRPAVFLHGVSVTYWVGALLPLFMMLWHREPALPTVRRFSAVAVPLVGVLVLTGTALAVVQVGTLSALTATAYGNVLLAKLAAVAGLLGLAAFNRLSLTPALSVSGAERRLAWSIGAEIALVVLIVVLVAAWRFTPPPRASVPAPQPAPLAEPAVALLHGERTMAQVTFTPGQVGPVRASITVMGPDHAPIEAKEVTVSMALPSLGVEPLERRATKAGAGLWEIESLPVPLPGRWLVRVEVLISDFEKAALEGQVEVKSAGSRAVRAISPDMPATKAFREASAKMHREMVIAYSGDADIDFVRGMIPHHQAAIDMAKIILEHGKDEQIRKLAADVIREQEREISVMQAWLKKRDAADPSSRGGNLQKE